MKEKEIIYYDANKLGVIINREDLCLKYNIYFVVLCFFLFLSQNLLACNSELLSNAILSNDQNVVKRLLEEGFNPNIFSYFSKLPSPAISELLLDNKKNPLNSSKFLKLIFKTDSDDVNKYTIAKIALKKKETDPREIEYFYPLPSIEIIELLHSEGNKPLSSNELLSLVLDSHDSDKEAKDKLVEYLIKKCKANYQNINSIGSFPSLNTSKLLFSIGLEPNKFLDLILSSKSLSHQSGVINDKELKELIDFVVQKGASSNKFSQIEDALKNKEEFIDFNFQQAFLLKQQGALFLEKYSPANIDIDSVKKRIDKFEKRGHCHGFTTLWLYSKWLQFNQPEKIYDKNWFKNTVKDLSSWDGKRILDAAKIANFHKLFSSIDFFQSPREFIEGMADGDINVHKIKNILTNDKKILKERYKIAASFAFSEQLATLLEKIIHENTLIYVMYPSKPGQPRHSTGIFKHDSNYYLYDPNSRWGERKYNSIKEIARDIFNNEFCNENHGIGFIICELEEETRSYLSQESILAEIHKSSYENNAALGAAAEAAICVRSLESLLFFLSHGLEQTYKDTAGRSLLNLATLANSPEIIAMLLKKTDVDPNQLIVGEIIDPDTLEAKTQGGTCLHLAAQKGYFEIVKIFLNDPRIIINQKDSTGKTALDYAIEKKHEKTKILLTNLN